MLYRPEMGILEPVRNLLQGSREDNQLTALVVVYRGVYLCIRCSGIHRGMGTHISKVKSIDLDTWTSEHMQVCTTLNLTVILISQLYAVD